MNISLSPLWISLQVGLTSAVVCLIFGTVAAWFVTSRRRHSIVDSLMMIPLVIPPSVTGFLLLQVFGRKGPLGHLLYAWTGSTIIFTKTAAVLAAIVVSFPLMYQQARSGFRSVRPLYQRAAHTLGANRRQIFWSITMPLSYPKLLAGFLLSFARSIGEFGATLMLAGNIPGKTQTLSTAIYTLAESGDMDAAYVYVMIVVVIGISVSAAVHLLSHSLAEKSQEDTHARL